jgi:large subunit ribosomal protein L11
MASATRTFIGTVKLLIPAGKASPSPPVGPALGQKGINLMEFCKDFNAKTKEYADQTPIPVEIKAYSDKTFTYTVKSPPTSWFLKRAAGVSYGASQPGKETIGVVTLKHVYEIAKIKQVDVPHISLESLCKSIIGQARSVGIRVVKMNV